MIKKILGTKKKRDLKKLSKEISELSHEDLHSLRQDLIDTFTKLDRALVLEIAEASRIAHADIVKDKNVKRLRDKTNSVTDERLLVAFLYVLMRDELTPGRIEANLLKLSNENVEETHNSYVLTNGYLANYAQDIADRLLNNRLTGPSELP